MLPKKVLQKISRELNQYQKERNHIIETSRHLLQASKEAIFALHRQDKAKADSQLQAADKILRQLNSKYNKGQRLRFEGSYKAAVEEYVEAKLFAAIVREERVAQFPAGEIGPEEYIGGLADVTGELVRQAVLRSSAGHNQVLKIYREITEEIVGFMLQLYLTGSLRQKFDDAKRNLKRLEQMEYEINLRS
ncbi:MAG: hypothetical protein NUV82_04005 [Candidatus Komeilibacteria bacterium]|nr:hypothetical protein [Candidatus Komeilibacteria bacterium]